MDVHLKVAGQLLDRRYERRVWASIRRAGLESRFWHINCPDLSTKTAFFSNCHVVSVPCRTQEVDGTAVMEAMAMGIPVVLPDTGVFPEMLARTGGGLLFPSGDTERLADALGELAAEPERAASMGLEGREGIRVHYAAARMAEATYGLYAALLS